MDALVCLDMAHQWRLVEDGRVKKGPFTGTPQTVKMCMVCGGLKIEVCNWRGYIISRTYKSDPVYIENARKLAPDVHERRATYRRLKLGRLPKNICDICWIVHPKGDCPY